MLSFSSTLRLFSRKIVNAPEITNKKQHSILIENFSAIFAIALIAFGMLFFPSLFVSKDNTLRTFYYAHAQKPNHQNNEQQSLDKITIKLNSIKFAPSSSNKGSNLLKVLVDYNTNDASTINSPMSGIMKVYLSNGTLARTSPIGNGIVVEKSGTATFSTSFMDNTIKKVKVTVYLTDALKLNKISNEISAKTSLTK